MSGHRMENSLFMCTQLCGSLHFYPRKETVTICKVVCIFETPDSGEGLEVHYSPICFTVCSWIDGNMGLLNCLAHWKVLFSVSEPSGPDCYILMSEPYRTEFLLFHYHFLR